MSLRLRSWLRCAMVLALACTSVVAANTRAIVPKVTISAGTLEGLNFDAGAAFLGVPYAAPPVGKLRWAPPQPSYPWSGTRMAVQFGPACPQLRAGWLPYPVWSENCLYLNIWTPKLSLHANLPVIVYFHGGSNRAGYSQLTPVGPALSPLGVVIVTANYRLGPFGFFAYPALTATSPHHASGNYGILDQIQALRWVKQNIAAFGGDPNRVTVMGQSSGAYDVCLMMASPLARGLFQQTIMESGDCESTLIEDIRTPIYYNGIGGTGESNGERLAADLGVADGPGATGKLRAISPEKILKTWSGDQKIQFDAIVDGWVIPEQPARIFAEGRQAHIPVLVGSNADEATVFGPGPATVSDYWKYLRADTGVVCRAGVPIMAGIFRRRGFQTVFEAPKCHIRIRRLVYGARHVPRRRSGVSLSLHLGRYRQARKTWRLSRRRARLFERQFPQRLDRGRGTKKIRRDSATLLGKFCEDRPPRKRRPSAVARLQLPFQPGIAVGQPHSACTRLVEFAEAAEDHAADPGKRRSLNRFRSATRHGESRLDLHSPRASKERDWLPK